MNSFRFKIALLTGLVSGALLVGAGWVLWEQTRRTGLERIDRELATIGHSNLEKRHGHSRYVELDRALNFLSSTNSEYILHFDGSGRSVHTSTNWPASLAVESFPALTGFPPGVEVDPELIGPVRPPKGSRDGRVKASLPLKIPRFETRAVDGRGWRLAIMENPQQTLILGVDMARFEAGLNRLRVAYLTVVPVALLLVGVGAWLVSGRAMGPVNALAASMERLTAHGLDQRVDSARHDREFGRLVTVFNEMLDRLQKSFDQATRFSADASHELNTPLAIMQGEIEQALQRAAPDSEIQRAFSRQLEEIQRLKSITRRLLLLARADAGQLTPGLETVDLSVMIAATSEDVEVLAPHLSVETEIEPGIRVPADPVLLQQVFQNLAGNAVKYNHENGWVRMTLRRAGGRAVFEITNSGPGIAPEQRERVFDRFHRADDTRNRHPEGVGLGLSLGREIIRVHRGELKVVDSEPRSTKFRCTLDLAETLS